MKTGFKQHSIEVDESVLEQVVEGLDGIIGWLTYFGAEYVKAVREEVRQDAAELVQMVRSKAVTLYASELEEIYRRSPL